MSQPDVVLDLPARKLLLVGQPNVGRSLIFTRITRRYATVSNYPGTTVEITSALADIHGELRGHAGHKRARAAVVRGARHARSADHLERGRRRAGRRHRHLRRTLLLSLQLAEYGIPLTRPRCG